MNEDNEIMRRLEQQPERRVFTIECGNLPKKETEKYVKELMEKYKEKGLKFPDPDEDTYEPL